MCLKLKEIRGSFFDFLNLYNENEINILMNYLTPIVDDYNNDYPQFKSMLSFRINFTLLCF